MRIMSHKHIFIYSPFGLPPKFYDVLLVNGPIPEIENISSWGVLENIVWNTACGMVVRSSHEDEIIFVEDVLS